MRSYRYLALIGTLLMVAGFALMLQSPVSAQDAPQPEDPPFLAEYYHAWAGSAHADATAEAFNHWNTEAEGIPESCAKCHSTPGYRDFLGVDGSEFGVVDAKVAVGTVVSCDACHNSVASSLTSVTFPSGAVINDKGNSVRCMECHQGRASGSSVDAGLEKLGLTDGNTVSPDLGFINIHYYAAAATLYGGEAMGGYQFEGLTYQPKNNHVPGYDTCAGCHNQHTLEVRVEECAVCHEDVETVDDLQYIRMNGSQSDYDGDEDINEGIKEEIMGLQEMLMAAIQGYASTVAGSPIVYDAAAYPYFFIDTNDNGEVDEGENVGDNKYVSFTGNLLKAAYNYQVTVKDPGGFAHNPTYIIELLYDSIDMLNQQMPEDNQVDLSLATRSDPGHFDATGEPFRHWDAEGEVPGSCAKCHSAGGLPVYLKNGVNVAEPVASGLSCSTCHDAIPDFTVYQINEVTFPSGAKVSFGEGDPSNLCLNCHQGRESTVSVNKSIAGAGVGDDEVSDKLSFRNVHYFAAGASLFGGDVMGAYQFDGKEYNGRNMHAEDAPMTCTGCHNEHRPEIRVEECADCHEDVETEEDTKLIRMDLEDATPVDYDGDGDVEEPILDEITAFQDALLVAINTYAADKGGQAIAYSPSAYPYFFKDLNANGTVDADEANRDNGYASWTPNLLRAAYNYQYAQKDPGKFAHNPMYILQVLYDSIEAVGGDVSTFTRPEVTAAPAQ